MFMRLALASLAALILVASNNQSQAEASVCKGLSQTDCAAKTECKWVTKKTKCKKKDAEDMPEATPPQATPAQPQDQQ
jgi:hypothetical protein